MEREEIDAMWERIKALEENSLKVSKALGQESIFSIYGLAVSGTSAGGKLQTFAEYMGPKIKEAQLNIEDAQSIDRVIEVVREFNKDCIAFARSLVT